MPLYVCTKCDTEINLPTPAPWGKAQCPVCKNNSNTKAWSVTQRVAKANALINSKHPMVAYQEPLKRVLSYLDEKSLGLAMLVCGRWAEAGRYVLARYTPPMTAYGSMTYKLKDVLIAPTTGLLEGVQDIQLAVDQFPYSMGKPKDISVLNYILANQIKIDLLLGTDNVDTREALIRASQSAVHFTGPLKMHNKVWVLDRQGVIVGSPNVSFSGLEGSNIESFILIRSPRLGVMFGKYLQMLKAPSKLAYQKLGDEVFRELTVYNSESHRMKVAMAPLINITDFVVENLSGAVKIVVRQFLVSHKHWRDEGPGLDIVDVLCGMARKKVDIEIVLDQSAYEAQGFVREAAADLLKAGCKVYLQQPVKVVNTHNECLMHDKLILATLHDGVKRTLIGSAGFTSSVIANQNAECFISTDLDHVFDSMMIHNDSAKKTHSHRELVLKK